MCDSSPSHPFPRQALDRREAIKSGLTLSAALLLGPAFLETPAAQRIATAERPYLDVATQAARWLSSVAISDTNGMRWPANPSDPAPVALDLYNGTPGVVPFWLELHHATHDSAALASATAGADYLLSALAGEQTIATGLYTGLAGIAWVLAMVHRATGREKYETGARLALARLKAAAHHSERGMVWEDSTDIISGSAGIGLFLLWASKALNDAESLTFARGAGQALVAAGEPVQDGLRWKINARMPRNYPNFSHGAAGVSYFLAELHRATGERAFLDAATGGARYLQSIATTTERGGRMVFHSEPGNERLFYLSWCHGPAGTARLYHRLGQITGDAAYGAYVDALATATIEMKVPQRSPGFWNNISQCCGNSGVTEFFTSLSIQRNDRRLIDFAELVARDTIDRATSADPGLKWIQAENRTSPDQQVAQTGLMQGAAGVGLAMLHLDGALNGRKPFVLLPDNPFV